MKEISLYTSVRDKEETYVYSVSIVMVNSFTVVTLQSSSVIFSINVVKVLLFALLSESLDFL